MAQHSPSPRRRGSGEVSYYRTRDYKTLPQNHSEGTLRIYMFWDTHSHLNLHQFDEDWKSVVETLREKQVQTITVGTMLETSQRALDQAREFPEILRAIAGYHPAYIDNSNLSECLAAISNIENMLCDPLCVGIGECGYDFYRNEASQADIEAQTICFTRQIELARD